MDDELRVGPIGVIEGVAVADVVDQPSLELVRAAKKAAKSSVAASDGGAAAKAAADAAAQSRVASERASAAADGAALPVDLVRDVALELRNDARVAAFTVESENFESIHNHSAYALIEFDKRSAT